jgi:uncharacterized protein YjlB
MKLAVNPEASFSHHIFPPERNHPNNLTLPVLYYTQALQFAEDAENDVKELFESNGWTNSWSGQIDETYHYHSKAHKVIAVVQGDCMLQLGGDDGNIQKVLKGDVLVVPAGVALKKIVSSPDFKVVGAHPQGQECDKSTCDADQFQKAKEESLQASLPDHDPVFGDKGPVREIWRKEEHAPILQKERQF